MLKTVATGNVTGALTYAGTWDASANSPTLTSGVGTLNNYYVVSVAGTTTLDGISSWAVGDWAIFNGTVWQKVDGSNLGTMAYQNANAVVITGGTINSVSHTGGTFANANITSVAATFPNSYLSNSTLTLGNTTLTLGGTSSSVGNLTLSNVTISSGSMNVQVVNVTSTTSSTATFATSSLPLVPAGYIQINLNGTVVKVPYYSV
jgi:hypothetical protein